MWHRHRRGFALLGVLGSLPRIADYIEIEYFIAYYHIYSQTAFRISYEILTNRFMLDEIWFKCWYWFVSLYARASASTEMNSNMSNWPWFPHFAMSVIFLSFFFVFVIEVICLLRGRSGTSCSPVICLQLCLRGKTKDLLFLSIISWSFAVLDDDMGSRKDCTGFFKL